MKILLLAEVSILLKDKGKKNKMESESGGIIIIAAVDVDHRPKKLTLKKIDPLRRHLLEDRLARVIKLKELVVAQLVRFKATQKVVVDAHVVKVHSLVIDNVTQQLIVSSRIRFILHLSLNFKHQ